MSRKAIFSSPQRGAGATMVVILVILVVIFILGMSYMNYMKSEAHLTTRMLQNTTAAYLAEAAVDEAVLHVRKRMNEPGEEWHEIFRKPVSELENNPVTKDFPPVETCNLVSGSVCEVTITFEKVARFQDDPAPVPANREKYGALKFFSKVKLGGAEVSVEVKKDVKVVSLRSPPPLNKYTLWLWDAREDVPPVTSYGTKVLPMAKTLNSPPESTRPSTLNEPDTADYEAMDGSSAGPPSWKYTLSDSPTPHKRYPLCKQKVSYLYDSWDDFEAYCNEENVYRLAGTSVIHYEDSSELNEPVRVGGRVIGKGGLIFTAHSVKINNLDVVGWLNIATLFGTSIHLNHYSSNPFTGTIAAPFGQFSVNPETARIKGNVYANTWSYSDSTVVEHGQCSEDYVVTLSEQIINWKRGK